jgi:DNA-binding SARP family transcriptional activator/tetratricopeptide (TPR) repeat protein
MSEPPVRFRLLGPVRVNAEDGPVDIGGATARAVLAMLLVRGEAGASTEEVISSVWGGPGGATRDSAYHYLSALRKTLAGAATGAVLEARRPRYRLLVDPETVDWHRFRRLAAQARAARDGGDQDRAATLLRAALDLWHGPPLADVDDRLAALRRHMTEQRRAAIEALAAVEADRGHPEEVVGLLLDELSEGPVREGAAVLVIDALTTLGRRDDAGEVYRRVRRRLVDEQGLEPSAQLATAHRRALENITRPAAAPVPATVRPTRQPISGLPRRDPHFTGRDPELRQLVTAIGTEGRQSVCAIYGMGGAGKTALAVQAAYALDAAFPDGIIFLDLHGYTDYGSALTAAEILDRLVRRMRVDAAMISAEFDELVAYYHDLLDGRRILLVLDNARDAAQVRHALPRPAGCAAIVTSRRRLAALDDALVLPLDVLPQCEAVRLFRSVAGADRLRTEAGADTAVVRIVEQCGRLPLAVRIAAARHRARQKQSLADLEAKLSDEAARLTELDDEDRSVVASFRASLDDLAAGTTRTLALLALHLGGDFDIAAAAALADLPARDAARQLGQLADRHLLIEHGSRRYQFHDLVAAFARQYASTSIAADERAGALRRLADYFLRAAVVADELITPHRYRVPLDVLDRPVVLPSLPDYDSGLDWLTEEQHNLVQVCINAGAVGFDAVCWQLAYTLRGYYFLTKNWQPWIVTHEAALIAARRCADTRAEAMTADNLGRAYLEQGASDRAAGYYEEARRLFAAVGDRHGEHTARANLAWLLYNEQRCEEFLAEMRPVFAFYRQEGADRNAAITLRGIGLAEAELGRTAEAVADLLSALDTFERLGLRMDAAMTWNGLGEIYQGAGDTVRAVQAFVTAVRAAERSGSVFEHARAHHRLGELAAVTGNHAGAREHWTRAWEGYHRIGAPQAAQVRQCLDSLDG